MIVRILGEGQLEVPDSALDELNELDTTLTDACEGGDVDAFHTALAALLDRVRSVGTPLAADVIVPSDIALPPGDATIDEVRSLLTDEGLLPG